MKNSRRARREMTKGFSGNPACALRMAVCAFRA
jgi:hypothetical protein